MPNLFSAMAFFVGGVVLLIYANRIFSLSPEDKAKRKVFWFYEAAGDMELCA